MDRLDRYNVRDHEVHRVHSIWSAILASPCRRLLGDNREVPATTTAAPSDLGAVRCESIANAEAPERWKDGIHILPELVVELRTL